MSVAARSPLLLPPVLRAGAAGMAMDEATRASLEIPLESTTGGRAGSLIGAVDRCITGAGSRLLAEDLSAPLLDRATIEARLALVQFWHDRPIERAQLRDALRAIPDLGRALGRVVAGRGSPRESRTTARRADRSHCALHHWLSGAPDRPPLLDEALARLTGHGALTDLLSRALVPSPPTERGNGGYIADGYDAALDELRATSGDARRAIAAMEARYREDTGIATLKIRHNGVLGYFIEVAARHADRLMAPDSGFTHRQTMKDAVRFNSLKLHEEATRIAEAGGHALAAEEAHFEALVGEMVAAREAIAATAAALARIDVAAANAERAAEGDWCRPEIAEDAALAITSGRHPVVEAALAKAGDRFVSNDCRLGDDDRLWLIGGPKHGRQIDLSAPERPDRLAGTGGVLCPGHGGANRAGRPPIQPGRRGGQSGPRALDLHGRNGRDRCDPCAGDGAQLCDPGRGRGAATSTYDGLALAWAVAEGGAFADPLSLPVCHLITTNSRGWRRLARALSLHHVRGARMAGRSGAAARADGRPGGSVLWSRGRAAGRGGADISSGPRQGGARKAGSHPRGDRWDCRWPRRICRCSRQCGPSPRQPRPSSNWH